VLLDTCLCLRDPFLKGSVDDFFEHVGRCSVVGIIVTTAIKETSVTFDEPNRFKLRNRAINVASVAVECAGKLLY
jgi:hypothetical protein